MSLLQKIIASLMLFFHSVLPTFALQKGSIKNKKIEQKERSLSETTPKRVYEARIRSLYRMYLQREPTDIELKTDLDLFQVYRQTDNQIHAGIIGSMELRQHFSSDEEYVKNVYMLLLHRLPLESEKVRGVKLVKDRMKTKLAQDILDSAEYEGLFTKSVIPRSPR